MTREPILIAGGGIGGAAAALALARQGWPVRVLEQLKEFGEIGAEIQLGPNVYKMLEMLGRSTDPFGPVPASPRRNLQPCRSFPQRSLLGRLGRLR